MCGIVTVIMYIANFLVIFDNKYYCYNLIIIVNLIKLTYTVVHNLTKIVNYGKFTCSHSSLIVSSQKFNLILNTRTKLACTTAKDTIILVDDSPCFH